VIAVGLMSGTSLDGVDAALVKIVPKARSYAIELLEFRTVPFAAEDIENLRAVLPPKSGSTQAVAELHRRLCTVFGAAASSIARQREVD